MTKAQLEKFIRIRNESGFNSNLQFSIDAGEAGFNLNELGAPVKKGENYYVWPTEYGDLIEQFGKLRLEPKTV